MFCRKCGNMIPDGVKFCPQCGESVVLTAGQEEKDKKIGQHVKGKKSDAAGNQLVKLSVLGAVFLAVLVGGIVYLNSDTHHYHKCFRHGQKAYEKGEYAQAEESFLEAINYNDTEKVEAALLENYIAWGDAKFREGKDEEAKAHFRSALDESQGYVLNEESFAAIAESFIARADVYLESDDPLNAANVLNAGKALTQNEFLTARLEEKRQEIIDNTVILECNTYYEDGDHKEESYDAAGNLLTEIWYNGDGSLDWHNAYNYDAAGNLLTSSQYDGDGSPYRRNEYSYDAAGNQLTSSQYDGDGSLDYREERSYDAAGNQLTYSYYFGDGSLSFREEYSYDAAGNLLTETNYTRYGSLHYLSEYSYDAAGNLLAEISYDGDGSLDYRVEYSYDTAGNLLAEISYDGDGSLDYRHEYSYDTTGNLLTYSRYHGDGSLSHREEYSYDAAGNMLTEIRYDRGGIPYYRYEWSYDALGHLQKESQDEYTDVHTYEYVYHYLSK